MPKKKLEVVELNKEEEKIVLEEEQSRWALFWKKYGRLIYLISLIISLSIIFISLFVTIFNLNTSNKPIIKEISIDSDLTNAVVTLSPSGSLTNETAKDIFDSQKIHKTTGEVILVKTIETSTYILNFYSDYTAIKIMKNKNLITRIDSLDGNDYAINEQGILNTKAKISDVKKTDSKTYSWGTVNYYSDGSAEITDSKFNMFVRNSKDISENYISLYHFHQLNKYLKFYYTIL